MSNSTKWWIAAAAIAIAVTATLGASQDSSLEMIMQRKLDHAHAILEALIMEDYETLEESAATLVELSNEAGWYVLQTPEYTQRSTAFQVAASAIESSAKERNLEGAALGYVDMTLKCVQCHELLRGTRTAGEFGPAVGESAQVDAREWRKTAAAIVP